MILKPYHKNIFSKTRKELRYIILERGKWLLSELSSLLLKINSNCVVYKFDLYIVIPFQLRPTNDMVILTLYSNVMGGETYNVIFDYVLLFINLISWSGVLLSKRCR